MRLSPAQTTGPQREPRHVLARFVALPGDHHAAFRWGLAVARRHIRLSSFSSSRSERMPSLAVWAAAMIRSEDMCSVNIGQTARCTLRLRYRSAPPRARRVWSYSQQRKSTDRPRNPGCALHQARKQSRDTSGLPVLGTVRREHAQVGGDAALQCADVRGVRIARGVRHLGGRMSSAPLGSLTSVIRSLWRGTPWVASPRGRAWPRAACAGGDRGPPANC